MAWQRESCYSRTVNPFWGRRVRKIFSASSCACSIGLCFMLSLLGWRQTNAAQLLNCAARIRRQRQSEKLKGLILMCRICCSPPGNLGNHTGRLAVYKPFTGSPKVLLITTQGRPTHLTCGQTIMRIIIPRPRSWRKGKLHPLFGQNASLKTNNWGHRPTNKWEAVCVRLVMALFPASLT